jgi:RNA polymerase sigma-70 factor (ECF subfamily)
MVTIEPPATTTFEAFFLAEFPRLVTMLSVRLGDLSSAGDLAQDALAEAGRRWSTVAGLDRPGAWVRRVALNRSSNERRRRGRHDRAVGRLAGNLGTASAPPDDPDDELWAAVRSLPGQQRDAIVLHYVDDLPLAEIAEVLRCGEGTVKTHLQRGRAALTARLTPGPTSNGGTQ